MASAGRWFKAAGLRSGWRSRWRWLFGRDQSHLPGDALPCLAVSDPGVNETLTLRDAFSVSVFFAAKGANRDGGKV
jgi:hypothetical protein